MSQTVIEKFTPFRKDALGFEYEDGKYSIARITRKAFEGKREGFHLFAFRAYQMVVGWYFDQNSSYPFIPTLREFHYSAKKECALNMAFYELNKFAQTDKIVGNVVSPTIFGHHYRKATTYFELIPKNEGTTTQPVDLMCKYLKEVSYFHNYAPCMVVDIGDAKDGKGGSDIRKSAEQLDKAGFQSLTTQQMIAPLKGFIDATALELMFRHNESDIVLLATLMIQINKFLKHSCQDSAKLGFETKHPSDAYFALVKEVLYLNEIPQTAGKSFTIIHSCLSYAHELLFSLEERAKTVTMNVLAEDVLNFVRNKKGSWGKGK